MRQEQDAIIFNATTLGNVNIGLRPEEFPGNSLLMTVNQGNAQNSTTHTPYAFLHGLKIAGEEIEGFKLVSPADKQEPTGIPVLNLMLNFKEISPKMELIIYTPGSVSAKIDNLLLSGNLRTQREIEIAEINVYSTYQTEDPSKDIWIEYVKIPDFKSTISITPEGDPSMTPMSMAGFPGIGGTPLQEGTMWTFDIDAPVDEVKIDRKFGGGSNISCPWMRLPLAKL